MARVVGRRSPVQKWDAGRVGFPGSAARCDVSDGGERGTLRESGVIGAFDGAPFALGERHYREHFEQNR